MMPEFIGDAELLGFVACPSCKRDCAILKMKRGVYYQYHRVKSRGRTDSDTHVCPRSGCKASAIDVLALLAGRTTQEE